MRFSILIPSWNNLPYLQLCVKSILQNSDYTHQIIIHVNEGNDGTLEFVKKQGLDFTFSKENIGICMSLNRAFSLCATNYIIYMNDDMYVCPGWDSELIKKIPQDNELFMLSSTLIEHTSKDSCRVIADYGKTTELFKEKELLAQCGNLMREDWQGSTWPPTLVSKKTWEKAGGYSEEFSPGLYSDPDFSMKLWQSGCRDFIGCGKSLVYHFQSKSLFRIPLNNGKKQFFSKWRIKSSTFMKYFLRIGERYDGKLKEPEKSPRYLIKRMIEKLGVIVILFFIFTACEKNRDSGKNKIKHNRSLSYYDLSGLLKKQITLLEKNSAQLEKFVYKDLQQDRVLEKNPVWGNILSPLIDLDINKPAWSGSYQVEIINSSDSPPNKNIFYTLLPDAIYIPVKRMEIYGYNKLFPDSLLIRSEEKNLLYFSRKNLYLGFSDSLFQTIKIEGVQKIRGMDTVRFGFRGLVRK